MKFELAENRARRALVVTILYLVGIACFQVAWILGVMPFGQMDEIDHTFRAASVAHGHITDHTASPLARGDLIRVPASLVTASHVICVSYKDLKPGNCKAVSTPDGNGDVLVGSAAALYNPAYYAVVGPPSVLLFPHSGNGMMYAMRAFTALWVDLLLGLGVYVAARVARTGWPVAGVMVATMPVLLCASAAAAPNGVQMAGGFLMWCALGALIVAPDLSTRARSWLIALVTLGGVHVLVMHSTGPLWMLFSALATVIALGVRRTIATLKSSPRAWAASAAVLGVVGLASAAWTVLEKTNLPGTGDNAHLGAPPISTFFSQPIVWIAQCIAAVPFREQFAPLPVIAAALGMLLLLLVLAFRRAPREVKRSLAFIAIATLAISEVLNASTFSALGNAWQGRYTLAFALGLPLLAGWALDRAPRNPSAASAERVMVGGIGLGSAVINGITIVTTFLTYQHPRWPRSELGHEPSVALLVALAVIGTTLVVAGAVVASRAFAAPVASKARIGAGEPIPASA